MLNFNISFKILKFNLNIFYYKKLNSNKISEKLYK